MLDKRAFELYRNKPECEITDEEKKYIANDVLVVKEALEIMFNEGHNGVTIGSCCLKEFEKTYDKEIKADIFGWYGGRQV